MPDGGEPRDDGLEDSHIGDLVPAQPDTVLVRVELDDLDEGGIRVDYHPVIAWILDEYTEPAIPVTATGHYPNRSDSESLVMVQCGRRSPLYMLGGSRVWWDIEAAKDWFSTQLSARRDG